MAIILHDWDGDEDVLEDLEFCDDAYCVDCNMANLEIIEWIESDEALMEAIYYPH